MSRIEEIFNKINFILEDMCMQDFEKFYKIFSISNFPGTAFSCFPYSKSTIFLFFSIRVNDSNGDKIINRFWNEIYICSTQ